MLKINSVNYLSNQVSVKNNNSSFAYSNNNQADIVSFKAKRTTVILKTSFLKKLCALFGIGGAVASVQKINETQQEQELPELEKQGREYFESVLNQPFGQSYWFNAFREYPEILEKLLMEECTHNGKTGKRLDFVDVDKVVGAFYKDSDAIERIFTKEVILNYERNGKTCIDRLLLNCPDVTNKIMLTPDKEGKLLLHTFAQEHDQSNDKYPWTPFYDINKNYERRNKLHSLAEMYLTKDSNGKYPLDYIKDKDEKVQENVLTTIKRTFEHEPELLKKILENYSSDSLEEEMEMEEKIIYALDHGTDFIDYDGNRIHIKLNNRSLIREILSGKRNFINKMFDYEFKKYAPDGRLLVVRDWGEITTYKYDDKNQPLEKEVKKLGKMHGSGTEYYRYIDGQWVKNQE